MSSKSYFCRHLLYILGASGKANSSEIPVHGIHRSVKLFLQPVKLREISIMMSSWNYKVINSSVSYTCIKACLICTRYLFGGMDYNRNGDLLCRFKVLNEILCLNISKPDIVF